MQLETVPRMKRRTRRKPPFLSILFLLVIIGSAVAMSYYIWDRYYPNSEHVTPGFDGIEKPIFYQFQMMEQPALGEGVALKLPLSAVQQYIDSRILYEEATRSIIITTADRVMRMKTDQLTAMLNEKPFDLQFPVEIVNDEVYVPVAPLLQFFQIELRESEDTGAVFIVKSGDIIQWGRTATIPKNPERTIALRAEATVKSPILADLAQNQEVIIGDESEGWYRVQLLNGYSGYISKKQVILDRVEVIPEQQLLPAFVPWKPLGGKINLTWEMVTSRNPDTGKIGPMPGLNVISPTWFELLDGEGNIKNLASVEYVRWAHEQNIQVWALFSNKTEPDWTSSALATYDKRMKMIKQLISYAQMYQLQGINIDFEYMYLKDKENLVQFVREMVPLMHEQGLVVSIDVTPKSSSEMWSMFYDRKALGEVVDYMIIMGYDQHGGGSRVSGSVATIPWVDTAISRIIEEDQVPPHKLVLAVPFYTRIWTEEIVGGETKVSSRAVFMSSTDNLLSEKKLTPQYQAATGQHYVEYVEGGKLNKIWLEDEVSMIARLELIRKYDLAGVASWRRGYESAEVWEWIRNSLDRRP